MKNKNIDKVNEYLTGHINKTRGIVNENKIIEKYEKKIIPKLRIIILNYIK